MIFLPTGRGGLADPVLQFGLGMWSSGWALHDGSGGKVFSCENNWHPVSWVAGGTDDG